MAPEILALFYLGLFTTHCSQAALAAALGNRQLSDTETINWLAKEPVQVSASLRHLTSNFVGKVWKCSQTQWNPEQWQFVCFYDIKFNNALSLLLAFRGIKIVLFVYCTAENSLPRFKKGWARC